MGEEEGGKEEVGVGVGDWVVVEEMEKASVEMEMVGGLGVVEEVQDLGEPGQEATEGEMGEKEEKGEGEVGEKVVIRRCGRRRGKKVGLFGEPHRLKTRS